MPKSQEQKLARLVTVASGIFILIGCADFNQRYRYSGVQHRDAIHTVVSDHDNDQVMDYGDVCQTTINEGFVDSKGCSPYRYVETNPPFSMRKSCDLPHTGSH